MPRTIDLKAKPAHKPEHHRTPIRKEEIFKFKKQDSKKEEPKEGEDTQKTIVVPAGATYITEWISQESLEYEHPAKWYWGIGTSSVLLLGFSLYTHDYLFFVFIIVTLFYMAVSLARSAKVFPIKAYDRGLLFDSTAWHPFDDYLNYSLIELDAEGFELYLQPKKKFSLPIECYIHVENVEKIREALKTRIPEIDRQESFVHLLGRILRF